jgi:hypothetical protein
LAQLRDEYSTLFGVRSEGAETTSGNKTQTFLTKYGWLYTVDNMTNGRPELWDWWFDLNIIEFLNRLAYHKAKGAYERQLQKQKHR